MQNQISEESEIPFRTRRSRLDHQPFQWSICLPRFKFQFSYRKENFRLLKIPLFAKLFYWGVIVPRLRQILPVWGCSDIFLAVKSLETWKIVLLLHHDLFQWWLFGELFSTPKPKFRRKYESVSFQKICEVFQNCFNFLFSFICLRQINLLFWPYLPILLTLNNKQSSQALLKNLEVVCWSLLPDEVYPVGWPSLDAPFICAS